MGKKRVVVEDGVYHVMSRIAHREFFLGEDERERLAGIVWRAAYFCGVEVEAYAVLSNHFHILVHVPPPTPLTVEEVLLRYEAWKGAGAAQVLRRRWEAWTREGAGRLAEEAMDRLVGRMHSLSKFMQLLKEWFSTDYNARTGHVGTLWERVFKSVLVDPSRVAVSVLAAYIDLNAVRAGMADNPATYRWSSYGEACASGEKRDADPWRNQGVIRRRYAEMYGVKSWPEARSAHALTMRNLEETRKRRELLLRKKGMLAEGEHLRIRAFADGVVVGTQAFVQEVFRRRREVVSNVRRSCPGSKISWTDNLYSLREIRDRAKRGKVRPSPVGQKMDNGSEPLSISHGL